MVGILLFISAMILLLVGFPVAFTFGGIAVIFGLIFEDVNLFAMMSHRIWAIMTNTTLMSIPMFIFMGLVLQKSGMAEKLLESMGTLFGGIRGGLAISTVLVGMLLAATTGVVGASVVAMGVISLPVMLKYHYQKGLACGTICTSGTLGQIIPPSVILILLGDVLQVPVGDLFKAAVIPGIVLVIAYIVFILVYSYLYKDVAPAMPKSELPKKDQYLIALKSIIPPMLLIIFVLGSIFSGIATPTESSSIGAIGSIILAFVYRKLKFSLLKESALETVKITTMVFTILIGATAFSMVFSYSGGDTAIEEFMKSLPGEKWGFLILSMLFIFLLGFFLDFVEICFIVVPVLGAIAMNLGIDPIWFGILVAVNLQTSFLTPPFGFSLFYLKGVAPIGVKTTDIYKGVVPFVLLQLFVLALLMIFPTFFGFNPFK